MQAIVDITQTLVTQTKELDEECRNVNTLCCNKQIVSQVDQMEQSTSH